MKLQNEAWRHRKRRRREDVKRLIDEFEISGSDRAEFCRSQGLALSTQVHNWGIRTSRELSQVTIETFAAIDESWPDELSFPGCKGGT